MKHETDIDIDFGSRDSALALLDHIPATIIKDNVHQKHNTGVYVSSIPVSPATGHAALDHKVAEKRGYFKLDFLNVNVYSQVNSEEHLQELLNKEPPWSRLWTDPDYCAKVIHIGNYYELLGSMKPDSIPRMAMFLSIIRPAKRHLQGKPWKEVAETVWDKVDDGQYGFKKSHSVSYSALVVVHMNLIVESDV